MRSLLVVEFKVDLYLHMETQVPAGLEACLQGVDFRVDQEGGRNEWMQYSTVKLFTNAFIIDTANNRVSVGPVVCIHVYNKIM